MPHFYVVTDCEFDGPTPGANSMLSFGSVAVSAAGRMLGEFEAVLEPLDGAVSDPGTMAFWQRHPEAWAAATSNPEPAAAAIKRFVDWIKSLDASRYSQHIQLASTGRGSIFICGDSPGGLCWKGHGFPTVSFGTHLFASCRWWLEAQGEGSGNVMSTTIRPNGLARSNTRIVQLTTLGATPIS